MKAIRPTVQIVIAGEFKMLRTIVILVLSVATNSTVNAQWQAYGRQASASNRSIPVIQPGSYVYQDQNNGQIVQEAPSIQNGVQMQSAPGQSDFFDDNQANGGIDHQQELREHQEFTGFDMTDSQISNIGIADRQGGNGGGGGPGGDMGDLATQSNNPVGGLWMLWNQNDMTLYEGPLDGKRIFNTYVFQPVLPIQLNDKWRVINRPVFMINAWETPDQFNFTPGGSFAPPAAPNDPFSTKMGLGDTAFIQWFSKSPEDSKIVFGAGMNWMFPTATNNDLGTGKWSAGPSLVGIYLGDKIITGGVMQQYWSYAGPTTREDVSFMDFQWIYRYRLNPMFSIGGSPNIKWDQITGKWTVPIGFGFDSMTMWQGKPARFGAELQYFASHSNNRPFDPEWNIRLYFSPIIQAPDWAKRGILGSKRRRCNSCY
jgi:hypothetical protein